MGNDILNTTLFRVNPAQNMARFHSMTIQPNLLGGLSPIEFERQQKMKTEGV